MNNSEFIRRLQERKTGANSTDFVRQIKEGTSAEDKEAEKVLKTGLADVLHKAHELLGAVAERLEKGQMTEDEAKNLAKKLGEILGSVVSPSDVGKPKSARESVRPRRAKGGVMSLREAIEARPDAQGPASLPGEFERQRAALAKGELQKYLAERKKLVGF